MIEQEGNRFIYSLGTDVLGEISFIPLEMDKQLIADHTYVSPAARGQGIAKQLLDALVAYARKHQLTIVPQCSYVQSMFTRHNEQYQDVIAKNSD